MRAPPGLYEREVGQGVDEVVALLDLPVERHLDDREEVGQILVYGLLHAENLTQIWVQIEVAKLFAQQASQHEERAQWLHLWLEQAEPLVKFHLDKIQNTGKSVLKRLNRAQSSDEKQEKA